MKKLDAALLSLILTFAACGGTSPEETERGGIAALDQNDREDGGEGRTDKDTARDKRDDAGGGGKTKTAAGATPEPAATGGGSEVAPDASGDGTDGTRAAAVPTAVPEGRYDYATDGERTISGNSEDLPKTTTLTAAAPADGVQRQTRDLRDPEGNGTVTETDLHFRDTGVFLSYVKVTSRFRGGLSDVREFRLPEPELIAPRGAGPGFARTFTMQGSGTRAKVAIRALRYEDVAIAGEQIRALVVQTTIEFSGSLEGHQTSTSWFWPKHLLPLRERVRTDVTNGPIRLQSNYRAVIEQLR